MPQINEISWTFLTFLFISILTSVILFTNNSILCFPFKNEKLSESFSFYYFSPLNW